ncbi:MAG: J domain-containing protein [Candidatus Kapabacteria bacterium]|nr:J domain-containing protein [Candidatus Kapabacteria bacterium]
MRCRNSSSRCLYPRRVTAPFPIELTMNFTDYYKELELERTASEDDIKKAFRRLARQYHPDANPDNPQAEERFKRISEAYEVLGDATKRAKYDQLSRQTSGYQRSGGKQGAPSFSMDDVGDMFSGTSFGDLLSELFGQTRSNQRTTSARSRAAPRRMPVYTVTLSLGEAFAGVSKRLTLGETTADVSFRPGIASGQKLRIGNAELEVTIAPDVRFHREGDDLHVRHQIELTTALLGGRIEIQTLAGAMLAMTVPPGTQNERKLRLKGQGMPRYTSPDDRGDLYVTLEVKIPSALNDEQKDLVQRLRESGL